MKSVDKLRELGKYTEPCIWTADDVKSAVMIEKETFDKCLDNIEREVADMVAEIDALPMTDENMAAAGWVKLPVDADGEPIHVGDVIDNIVCPSVHREVTGVGVKCFYGWDEGNGRYSQFDVVCYRHHHAPTVEDVLREFAYGLGVPVADSYVAAAAAKLALRGDE